MEKLGNSEKKYLSAAELADGMMVERHAYLLKITRKLDVNGNPYLTFYLRTIDHTTIIGHKFRVHEDDSTGANILTYNRMMVRTKFEVQIYNGAYVLLIKDISLLPSDRDTSLFFESFTQSEQEFTALNDLSIEYGLRPLSIGMKTASLFSVRYGVTGAYLELLSSVRRVLQIYSTDNPKDLDVCFLALANPYFQYLQFTEKLEFLPKKEVMEILQSIVVEGENDLTSVVIDTLTALMKQGKPEHLYAHLIYDAFELVNRRFMLEDMVKTSPKNLVVKLPEGRLIYY